MTSSLPSIDDLAAPSPGDLRKAGIRLAGQALTAAAGDQERAGAMLRPVLEAIGFLPYEHARGKYHYGEPPAGAGAAERPAPAGS